MEDIKILDLFFKRDERAIEEVDRSYKNYLMTILGGLLASPEDRAECINDTYMSAWNSIPPKRPNFLNLYLAKIARNTALNMIRKENSGKRVGKQMLTVLEELEDVVDERNQPEGEIIQAELKAFINQFLYELPELEQSIFVRRYWYIESVAEIASELGLSKTNVKVKLHRVRNQLKAALEKEGYEV